MYHELLGPTYYNDNDPYCCAVLKARIKDGSLPPGHVDPRDIEDVDAASIAHFGQWHLFAGIGGFPLGLEWSGRKFSRILTGGFPCQDLSFAGAGRGLAGERSGLWWHMHRLIGDLRPDIVLVENVSALLVRGLDVVLGSLAAIGYDCEWHCIPAAHVGAPHRRDRVWIVGYPSGTASERRAGRLPAAQERIGGEGQQHGDLPDRLADASQGCQYRAVADAEGVHDGEPGIAGTMAGATSAEEGREPESGRPAPAVGGSCSDVADASCGRRPCDDVQTGRDAPRGGGASEWWRHDPSDNPQSGVGRVADGVPARVDRLRALGNSVVPQNVQHIGEHLTK